MRSKSFNFMPKKIKRNMLSKIKKHITASAGRPDLSDESLLHRISSLGSKERKYIDAAIPDNENIKIIEKDIANNSKNMLYGCTMYEIIIPKMNIGAISNDQEKVLPKTR